ESGSSRPVQVSGNSRSTTKPGTGSTEKAKPPLWNSSAPAPATDSKAASARAQETSSFCIGWSIVQVPTPAYRASSRPVQPQFSVSRGKRRDRGKRFAFEELEESAAPGGDIGDVAGD